MTSVEFEKMLSARPRLFHPLEGTELPLRELVLHYYEQWYEDDKSLRLTKEYTDALAQMMGVK